MLSVTRLLFSTLIFAGSLSPVFCYGQGSSKMQTLTLITHEAPPYMGEALDDQGAVFFALRKALKPIGYDLKVQFVSSWIRAKMNARKDPKVDGYAPYRVEEDKELFEFSEFVIESPWVIVERKENPVRWKNFEDLTKYTAGNVQGVELRPGVKELVDGGQLKVETTTTQNNNILKLVSKRIDFVFADIFVYRYLMATDPLLRPHRKELQVNAKPIVLERYGLALRKSKDSMKIIGYVNKHKTEIQKYVGDYLLEIERKSDVKAKQVTVIGMLE
jgi:polar amino acid transport system substrate-binding protein